MRGVRLGYSAYVAAKAAMDGLNRQHATECHRPAADARRRPDRVAVAGEPAGPLSAQI